MDYSEALKRKINPREKANVLSLLTFWYTIPLFRKAIKKELEEPDLYEVTKTCNSTTRGNAVERTWTKLVNEGRKPTIFKLLWACFGFRYCFLGGMQVLFRIMQSILQPHALSKVIGFFKEGQNTITKSDVYYWTTILWIFNMFGYFYIHNYIMATHNLAIQVKTALSSLIYRKALRLSPAALMDVKFGNIVTLITKDVQVFQKSIRVVNDMWIYTIQAFVVSYLLFLKMGSVSFMGVGTMLFIIPVQMYLGHVICRIRLKVGSKTDERLQITQETLSAIKIIKMYTCETYFNKKVTKARRRELSAMMKVFYLKIVVVLLGILSSKVSFYALISVYLWLSKEVSPEFIFYIVACFKDLRHSLGLCIPRGLTKAAEVYAAIQRINTVLVAEEQQMTQHNDEITMKPKIEFKGVSVKIKNKEILKDINLSVTSGLNLITGSVGSGKTSLLKTILQDYPKDLGELVTFGKMSYASQEPWLFPSTVKQNILFGNMYNAERYEEVIRVCALKFDLNLFENGDDTIVLDRGANLSKGQQARINLARAVYCESDIYLLDDSLNALDNHVQDYIFSKCIKEFLKGKLVVLVTQSTSFLEKADNVIIMHQGGIKSCSKPSKILIEEISNIQSNNDDSEKDYNDMKKDAAFDETQEEKDDTKPLIEAEQTIKKKVYQEQKNSGSVNLRIYHKYLVYGGGYIIFIFTIYLFFMAQYTESYSDKLLGSWTDQKQKLLLCNQNNITTCSEIESQTDSIFNLFSIMILLSLILSLTKSFLILNFGRIASLNIHNAMISTIINAEMYFFDSHFIGNIINRFSQDLNNIDEQLPDVLSGCFKVSFSVGGIFTLLAIINWRFLVAGIVFMIILFVLRKCYMPTGRSLKRLEASTRSPLMGHLNATLEGLTTIKAFQKQCILRDEFDRHQDLYISAHFTLVCTMRAFAFLMDLLCSGFIIVVLSWLLFFNVKETAGNVGIALTQVFMLAGHVQRGVREWADLENEMTSVERVIEYTEIKTESTAGSVPQNWPGKGAIKYYHVSLTYPDTHEKVLKDLNIQVNGGQKIGIVGRTGAGKSSIISTLFRLHETKGSITIDGIDIKTVQLRFLRQSIAIIPQDPILFTGTIRSNIDPLCKYQDKEIWDAIKKVKINDLVPDLTYHITEGDNHFSSGQKQLICLARALIRNNKIVVMDEATANMDPETDVQLQNIIKENFKQCTVFTIAHRLQTIIDYDKILVLDRGTIVEFDSPQNLLNNKNGWFYKMMEQSANK